MNNSYICQSKHDILLSEIEPLCLGMTIILFLNTPYKNLNTRFQRRESCQLHRISQYSFHLTQSQSRAWINNWLQLNEMDNNRWVWSHIQDINYTLRRLHHIISYFHTPLPQNEHMVVVNRRIRANWTRMVTSHRPRLWWSMHSRGKGKRSSVESTPLRSDLQKTPSSYRTTSTQSSRTDGEAIHTIYLFCMLSILSAFNNSDVCTIYIVCSSSTYSSSSM